jgi:hypothetical protein
MRRARTSPVPCADTDWKAGVTSIWPRNAREARVPGLPRGHLASRLARHPRCRALTDTVTRCGRAARLPALARRKVKQKPLLPREIDQKLVPPGAGSRRRGETTT